jgi:hypothetical protein
MTTQYNHDYHTAQYIEKDRRFNFYPCLIAAMAQADDTNLAILKKAFPDVYEAWQQNRTLALQCKMQDFEDEKKASCWDEE